MGKKATRKPRAKKEEGVDEVEEEDQPATLAEKLAGSRLEEMGFDLEELSIDEAKKIEELEKTTDDATAQDMALKAVLNEKQWVRYERDMKQVGKLNEEKQLDKGEALQNTVAEWVNRECLKDQEQRALVVRKAADYVKMLKEVRVQKKLQAKLRRVKTRAVETALPAEQYKEWKMLANAHQMAEGTPDEAMLAGRRADRFLNEHLGEMITGVILQGVRQARLADLKGKMKLETEKELQLIRLQLALAAVTDQDAKLFMDVASQFGQDKPIFIQAEKDLFANISNENRQAMTTELQQQADNYSKAANINLAQALVPQVAGEVAAAVYSDEEWAAARGHEKGIEAAATEAGKASAEGAYTAFKAGLSKGTKAAIKEKSKQRFLEIAEATGCKIKFDDDEGAAGQ